MEQRGNIPNAASGNRAAPILFLHNRIIQSIHALNFLSSLKLNTEGCISVN